MKNSKLHFFIRYFLIIKEYSNSEIIKVVSISIVRYLIFSIQYVLLLWIFEVQLGIDLLFLGVAFVFLCKSVIPTFFDLGIRESSAIYFFSIYQTDEKSVLLASLVLWLINIILPSILGLMYIFKMKISAK
jgi:uncharacterized membrane protein YbhN (UPF0104 family)